MRLAIGLIFSGGYQHSIPTQFFQSWSELLIAIMRGRTPVKDLQRFVSQDFPIDCARNECCRSALEWGADYLLFLDCDQTFEVESVVRLLESGKDIITGRYHVKKPPYHPNLYVRPQEGAKEGHFKPVHYGRGVFTINRCGAGAMLISRAALEAIGQPWFEYGIEPDPPHDRNISEDFAFCERAEEEGFEIWADWDAEFGHIITGVVKQDWLAIHLAEMERNITPETAAQLVVKGMPDGLTLVGHDGRPILVPEWVNVPQPPGHAR